MRHYFRPAGFIDAPFGFDGQFHRLAGGLCFYSAYEVTRVDDDGAVTRTLVPIDRLDALIDALGGDQAAAARAVIARITAPRAPLTLGARVVPLDQPRIMAILNVTPDSFSDGGLHDGAPDAAAEAGARMAEAGASIIDVGGESTRPGAPLVWEGDEIARVRPVIERLARAGCAVSIDTRKAAVMTVALAAGAGMINDISALLYDEQAARIVADVNVPVVLMHAAGQGSDPHKHPPGTVPAGDIAFHVFDWLAERIAAVERAGIARTLILADPGIGFGKSLADNLALINALPLFHGLGVALVVGASRKRMIGALSNEAPVSERLGGSIALTLRAIEAGVQLVRVHDVPEQVQAVRVWRGLRDQALTVPA